MSDELKKDVLVVLHNDFQKLDRESNAQPSRVRFTSDTLDSLRENLVTEKYIALVELINDNARATINKIAAEEKALAAREDSLNKAKPLVSTAIKTPVITGKMPASTQPDPTTIIEAISKAEIAGSRLERSRAEIVPFNVLLGGKRIVSKEKGKSPRALSVRNYFKTIYSSIYKNLSSGLAVEDTSNLVHWQSVFGAHDGLSIEQRKPSRREQDIEQTIPEKVIVHNKALTEEELSLRRTLAQAGDELGKVRLQLKEVGNDPQFGPYLKGKEKALVNIVSDAADLKTPLQLTSKDEKDYKPTAFQELIMRQVGSADLDETPYHLKNAEIQEYYADEGTIAQIERQRLQQTYLDYNQPEYFSSILAAESRDNRLRGQISDAIDVLDAFDGSPSLFEMKPEVRIDNPTTKNSENINKSLQSSSEPDFTESAKIVARNIYEQAKLEKILNESATAEALLINSDRDIKKAAELAAKKLFEQAKFGEELQRSSIEEALLINNDNNIRTSAKLTAKKLFEQARFGEELQRDSAEEATRIYKESLILQPKQSSQSMPQNPIYTTTDISNRYAVQDSAPKALKLSSGLYSGIYRRVSLKEQDTDTLLDSFDSLINIKGQLESLSLGEDYDESFSQSKKVA